MISCDYQLLLGQQQLDFEAMRSGDAEYDNSRKPLSLTTKPVGNSDDVIQNFLPNNETQNTVFVNGPPIDVSLYRIASPLLLQELQ